ncbi:hypothetical protein [Maricaulis sp. CAU 1757]
MARRAGYVLPLALASIAVIAIVSTVAARQVQRSAGAITALADRTSQEVDMISAEQTLLYLLLTEPVNAYGLNIGGSADSALFGTTGNATPGAPGLPADGSPFRYSDTDTLVRLLDDQSFLNIATLDERIQARNLALFGIPGAEASRLAAVLADYQDQDDFKRLGGAEAAEYGDAPPPPNRPIGDALEACGALGWDETPLCTDPARMLMLARVRTTNNLNPRLVSEPMLRAMLEDPATAHQAKRAFEVGEYTSFAAVGRPEYDQELDPLSGPSFPGPTFVILTHPSSGTPLRRTVVDINLGSSIAPFFLRSKYVIGGEYARSVMVVEGAESVEGIPEPAANARSGGRSD